MLAARSSQASSTLFQTSGGSDFQPSLRILQARFGALAGSLRVVVRPWSHIGVGQKRCGSVSRACCDKTMALLSLHMAHHHCPPAHVGGTEGLHLFPVNRGLFGGDCLHTGRPTGALCWCFLAHLQTRRGKDV